MKPDCKRVILAVEAQIYTSLLACVYPSDLQGNINWIAAESFKNPKASPHPLACRKFGILTPQYKSRFVPSNNFEHHPIQSYNAGCLTMYLGLALISHIIPSFSRNHLSLFS